MTQFLIGDVLGRSIKIWLQNFIPFTLLSSVVYLPFIALMIFPAFPAGGEMAMSTLLSGALIMGIGGFVLDCLVTAALIYGVFQQLHGNHLSLGDCLRTGLKRLLPVLGVAILVALCVLGGAFFFIIPGIILALMLYAAVPVAVVERPGLLASLSRSRELTRGYKGHILVLVILLGIFEFIVNKVVELILIDGMVTTVVTLVVTIALSALSAVVMAVAYHDLRAAKEGVGIEALLRKFE